MVIQSYHIEFYINDLSYLQIQLIETELEILHLIYSRPFHIIYRCVHVCWNTRVKVKIVSFS